MIVNFKEDLQPNTTYTLDFADAIKDNNEGNVLDNFTFSFSTGEYIDSLAISGFLFDAANLDPVSGALVMVHKNLADSAFFTQVPIRVTRTNSKGEFSIQNLAPGNYRLFALEDANRDYKYDQPGERIAWSSELVYPYVGFHERIDSLSSDSAVIVKQRAYLPDSLQLFMFKEDNAEQYLVENKRSSRNKIDFIFNRSLFSPLEVNTLSKQVSDWFIYERSFNNDSITLWITDNDLVSSDSLMLEIKYSVLDSLKEMTFKIDTLNAFFFSTSESEKESRRNKNEESVEVLPVLGVSGLNNELEILEPLVLEFSSPVLTFDINKIRLFHMVDTVPEKINFDFINDSIRIRRYVLDFIREPGQEYMLQIDSAAFTDVYGINNDAIEKNIVVKSESSYGVFYINIEDPQSNWLLQMLNAKEEVIRYTKVPSNGKVGFRYLKPGKYYLRMVEDVNGNGKWDTGSFEKDIQPESIYYYPEEINIRANWDHIVPWDVKSFDIYDFVKRMRMKPENKSGRD